MAKMRKLGLDDESVKEGAGQATFFRGKKGTTHRICILDTGTTAIMVHWHQGTAQYVRCLNDFDDDGGALGDECPACKSLGVPRQKHGLLVCWYETDKRGEAIVSQKARAKGKVNPYEIAVWTFGDDKFCQLRAFKRENGDLRKQDFKVECTDDQFQRLTLIPCKTALWLETKQAKDDVSSTYKVERQTRDLERLLAKDYTADEMVSELGLDAEDEDEEDGEVDMPDLDDVDDDEEDSDDDEESENAGKKEEEEEDEEDDEEDGDDDDDDESDGKDESDDDLDKALANLG